MMIIVKRVVLIIALLSQSLCMRSNQQLLSIIAMPAADNSGCKDLASIYGTEHTIRRVSLPRFVTDLGQRFSQGALHKEIVACNQPVVLHGSCAGTSAALMCAVGGTYKDVLRAVVLDGALSSQNGAIEHRASNAAIAKEPLFSNNQINHFMAKFAHTPLGKYGYPLVLQCAGYCAFKESPLEAVSRLENKKLPIVIVAQCADDHAASPAQSYALYYRLRALGCNNTYLMQPDNHQHVDLLDPQGEKAAAIRRIVHGCATEQDRIFYQPSHAQFENEYTALMTHDREVRHVTKVVTTAFVCCSMLLARKIIRHKFSV